MSSAMSSEDNKENICPNKGTNTSSDECLRILADLKHKLRGNLLPHQVEGVLWLASRENDTTYPKAILADEMGLGKTLQVLGLMAGKGGNGPALVLAPKTVCKQWRNEIHTFLPSVDARVFSRKDWLSCNPHIIQASQNMVIISNYESVRSVEEVNGIIWDRLICDEAHILKNHRSKISATVREIQSNSTIFLTGTPITNTRKDLAGLLRNLQVDLGEFETLSEARSTFVLRRCDKEIADHVGDICFINHPVDLTTEESETYNMLCHVGKMSVDEGGGLSALDVISKLRQVLTTGNVFMPSCVPIKSKIDLTRDILEQCKTNGHKCIVFTQYKEEMNTLFEILKGLKYVCGRMEGSTPLNRRQTMLEEFIGVESPACLVVNMRVGSCGLNLQAADTVILYSPNWLASEEMQSVARCHRLGQTESVTVHRIYVRNTIEEYILQGQKKKVFHASEMLGDDSDKAEKKMGFEALDLEDIKACFHPHE
jgi:SNF2 family DNA or RNA helicase